MTTLEAETLDTPSSLEALSQSDLLERRAELNEKADKLESELDELLTPRTEKLLEKLEQMRIEDVDTQGEEVDETSYVLEHGVDILPDEFMDHLRATRATGAELGTVEGQLDARFGRELSEFVRQEAAYLRLCIDEVKMIDILRKNLGLPDGDGIRLLPDERELPVLSNVVWELEVTADGNPDDSYASAEMAYDGVERNRTILERWGVLLDEPYAKPEASRHDPTELDRAWELNNRYRVNYHEELHPSTAINKEILPVHEWGVNLKHSERRWLEMHLQAMEVEREVEQIKVTGLDLLPFSFTDSDLKWRLQYMPAIALEGLKEIEFRFKTDEEKKQDTELSNKAGKDLMILGTHGHDTGENMAKITILIDRPVAHYEQLIEDGLSPDLARYAAAGAMSETIDHELGHALHNKLPVALLHEWDKVARAEQVDVTEYVKRMHESDDDHYEMEDFAETFQLFINNRALAAIAPERQRFIQHIYEITRPQSRTGDSSSGR